MAFGSRFKAAGRAQLARRATPPYAGAPEAIWHQAFDTQNYTNTVGTTLDFFTAVNTDKTLSNMTAAGQFDSPKWLTMFDITADYQNQVSNVVSATSVAGCLNDLDLLLKVGRGMFILTISDKVYGPYSLTLLHGKGGAVGFIAAGNTAATGNFQTCNTSPSAATAYAASGVRQIATRFLYVAST